MISLPKCWEGFVQARGQVASRALIPTEQFGIGGYDTVRGYDEREYNADDALVLNLEVRTPSCKFYGKPFYKHQRFFGLAFLDYGVGHDIDRIPGQPKQEYLASVGLGLRYYMGDFLSFRVDYGFKLHDTQAGGSSAGKFHLGGFLTF